MENNFNNERQVTSLVDLQTYAKGKVVELPPFAEGQPLVARVRRPSMLVLAKKGQIPNTLLGTAGELFAKGGSGMKSAGKEKELLGDMYDICRIICESSLIEPTLEEIENAGLTMTDQQMMALFNYSQAGAKALEAFREVEINHEPSGPIEDVLDAAE